MAMQSTLILDPHGFYNEADEVTEPAKRAEVCRTVSLTMNRRATEPYSRLLNVLYSGYRREENEQRVIIWRALSLFSPFRWVY